MLIFAAGNKPITFLANVAADPCRLMEIFFKNDIQAASIHERFHRTGYRNPHPKYSVQCLLYRPPTSQLIAYAFNWCVETIPSQLAIIQSTFSLYLDSELGSKGEKRVVLARCQAGSDLMLLTYDLIGKPQPLDIIRDSLADLRCAHETDFPALPHDPKPRHSGAWYRNLDFNLGEAESEGVCIPSDLGWKLIENLVKHAVADVRAER
ncbi:MAG: hypothetical protein WC551_01810 [Patescibacteria group bacterium]